MLRLLILASLGAVVSASFLSDHFLSYPRSLQSLFGAKRDVEEKKEPSVCESSECKLIAKILKESMNETIDPCDDFYEYACGRWSSQNPLPENRTEWSLWVMVQEKLEKQIKSIIETKPKPDDLFAVKLAKKWYESCMDTDAIERRGVEPIISTLWRHGGWPLIMEEGEWDERIYHWQIVDDHFARLLGWNTFHDVRYDRITYEGNDTIVITSPHLPLGMYRLLDTSETINTDSSDENNESGEGSQEAGSKERGKEHETESEEEEEDNDEEEDENDMSNDIEDRNEVVKRKHHKRFGHGRRWIGHRVAKKGTKKRTKRDVLKKKLLHQSLHHLRKANKHKVKLSKHGHQSVSNGKRHEHKAKGHGMKRKSGKHLSHGKMKINKKKAMASHVHGRRAKKVSNVHVNKHHVHKKGFNHKVHRVAHRTKINHKKVSEDMSNDEESDNDIDTENESDNDIEEKDNNEESNQEDNENDNDDIEEEENSNDTNERNDDENSDEDKDEDQNEDSDEDNDEEEDDDDDEDDDYYDNEYDAVKKQMLREKYAEYILNVSLILSKARGIEIPKETLVKDIDNLFDFSIKLGQLTLHNEDEEYTTLRKFQDAYESMDSTTPNSKINWVKKVQKLFAEAGVDIDEDVEIVVMEPTYIKKLRSLLDSTPSRTIVNFIHWRFISMAVIAAPQELRSLVEQWFPRRALPPSRSSECIHLADISDIVAYQYVKQYFSEDIAKTARDMIDDIQKEVEYQIKASTWMNEETKHFVLDKLVNMKNLVGYPSWYQNTTLVKRYLQGLTIGPSYYENLQNYIRHMKWRNLRRILTQDEDRSEELMDPLMLNAFFMPTENSISITAADFQSPFFALNRPWSINFGIIGLVMGHEVNHGFDNEGRFYDHGGKLMEWLSAMAEAYNQRAECFVDQFNQYSVIPGENYTIKDYGNQTAGENIADTMGLQAVFRAFKRRERECSNPDPALPGLEKFNNDQIFFLSFANLWCESVDRKDLMRSVKYDVHSTARLRVIGSVSNSEDFAKAFNCPVDSPMNPRKKCNIWI